MNPRSFFNIIVKIFGLLFLKEIITSIPQVISAVFMYLDGSNYAPVIGTVLYSLFILAFYTFMVIQLLFRSNKFIDLLKLDQGFSETDFSFDRKDAFTVNLTGTAAMNIALIIIAGIVLFDHIPEFCRELYLFFSENKASFGTPKPHFSNAVSSGAKILIALLLLGERKRIVEYIESRKKPDATKEAFTE